TGGGRGGGAGRSSLDYFGPSGGQQLRIGNRSATITLGRGGALIAPREGLGELLGQLDKDDFGRLDRGGRGEGPQGLQEGSTREVALKGGDLLLVRTDNGVDLLGRKDLAGKKDLPLLAEQGTAKDWPVKEVMTTDPLLYRELVVRGGT